MFYAICGFLKNRNRIEPKLENKVIKDALKHPLKINDIITFKKYKMTNLAFYLLGVLPPSISVGIINIIGKKKKYI